MTNFSGSVARDENKESSGFYSPLVLNIARKENVLYRRVEKN